MEVTREIEKLRHEIAERESRILTLRQHDATRRAADLDSFQKMTPEERAALYRDSPSHWLGLMDMQREQAERRFSERNGGAA